MKTPKFSLTAQRRAGSHRQPCYFFGGIKARLCYFCKTVGLAGDAVGLCRGGLGKSSTWRHQG
jgi:hypothetical protein